MASHNDSGRGSSPRRPGRVPSMDHVPATGQGVPRPVTPLPPRDQVASEQAGTAHAASLRESTGSGARRAIVDGSNVAHAGEQGARLATLLAVRDELLEEGFEPIIVADAALRHQLDDKVGYERLVDDGGIQQAPAGTDADYFILALAKGLGASIVSNDRFRDGGRLADEAKKRQIRFMVVAGEVVLEKRTKPR